MCDRAGIVLDFRITAGQVNECTEGIALLAHLPQHPHAVAGDRGYATRAIRAWCRAHHVCVVIPERRDQLRHRAHRPGRKPVLDAALYRARNIVERVIGWLKRLRRIASRAEKLAVRYAGMISLALIARTANLLSDTT